MCHSMCVFLFFFYFNVCLNQDKNQVSIFQIPEPENVFMSWFLMISVVILSQSTASINSAQMFIEINSRKLSERDI